MARYRWLIVMLAVALVVLPACAKKQVAPVEQPVEQVPPPSPPPAVEQPPVDERPAVVEITLGDVYFEFDKYVISSEYKDVLTKNAELLMTDPGRRILVEGHCDERGTNEYNMALGEKRAKSVVDFYVTYGIDKSRITWISYGEDKPFDMGHTESAWAMNRRAHMVLQ